MAPRTSTVQPVGLRSSAPLPQPVRGVSDHRMEPVRATFLARLAGLRDPAQFVGHEIPQLNHFRVAIPATQARQA